MTRTSFLLKLIGIKSVLLLKSSSFNFGILRRKKVIDDEINYWESLFVRVEILFEFFWSEFKDLEIQSIEEKKSFRLLACAKWINEIKLMRIVKFKMNVLDF